MTMRRRFSVPIEPPAPELPLTVGFHAVRWLPVLVLALLTVLFFPGPGRIDAPRLESGQVALQDVVAPFDFDVRKTGVELAREGDQLAATVRPIYQLHPEVADSAAAAAAALFTALDGVATADSLEAAALARGLRLSRDEAAFLLEPGRRAAFRTAVSDFLRRELGAGIASSANLRAETAREIVVRRNGNERVEARESVPDNQRFLDARSQRHPAPNSTIGDQIYVKLLNLLFRPSLLPNRAETDSLRLALRQSVDSIRDRVRANELIVGAHQVVTDEAHARLVTLRAELVERGIGGGASGPRSASS